MQDNLTERLQTILPAEEWALLQRVADAASEQRLPLYVVGGLPRDILLGSPSRDLDLVVEGPAEALARALSRKYGGRVIVHDTFGTAKWEAPRPTGREGETSEPAGAAEVLDFITARSETYKYPGALPTVTPGTIADDLRRRDFAINAIAIRLDGDHLGEVRDDLGGRADLAQGKVRVLHQRSFIDDPTRMYRAVRYEQRYSFRIADDTLTLLPDGREQVKRLSPQRVRHELDLILDESRAAAMLARLAELDLLQPIHAALSFDEAAALRLSAAEHAPTLAIPAVPRRGLRWLLWLMSLPEAQLEAVHERLHFTASLRKDILGASQLAAGMGDLAGLAPSGWDDHLQGIPPAGVYAVCLTLPRGPARTALERYLSHWRHIRPRTTGRDLQELGVKPGAEYQRILRELRRAWLDGEVNSVAEEQAYLQQILKG